MVNAEEGYNPAAMPFNIGWWSLGLYLCTWLIWGVYGSAAAGGRNTWRAAGVLGLLVLGCAYRGGPDGKAWMTHQWWGILGLIGWSYLISASAYLAGRARSRVLLAATAACIASTRCAMRSRGELSELGRPDRLRRPGLRDLADAAGRRHQPGLLRAARRARAAAALRRRRRADRRVRRRRRAAAAGVHDLQDLRVADLVPLLGGDLHRAVRGAARRWSTCAGRARWVRWLAPVAAQPLVAYLIPFVVVGARGRARVGFPEVLNHGVAGVASASCSCCSSSARPRSSRAR